MEYVLVFALGLLAGILVEVFLSKGPKGVGTLKIVQTEEGPYLFLELNDEVESLYGRKVVSVTIDERTHE